MQHPLSTKVGTNFMTSGGRLVGIVCLWTQATELYENIYFLNDSLKSLM
jgi:hypothetical protein